MRRGTGQIPPVVAWDAVTVGVGSGANGGVAGRGHGVGVVVVTVCEVGPALEKEVEAVGGLEVIAIAVEIIASKLIENEDDNQLWRGVIRIGMQWKHGEAGEEKEQEGSDTSLHMD